MATKGKARAAFGALLLLAATAACGGEGSDDARKPDTDHARIHVDRPAALADERIRVRVSGLGQKERVKVTATAKDMRGMPWSAEGRYTTGSDGGLDLDKQAPAGARPYRKPDSMGLLEAMLPQRGPDVRKIGSGKAFSYHPPSPSEQRSYDVRLTVTKDGKQLAGRTIERKWLPGQVRHRKLTVAEDKVDGELYTPPKGSERRAPVLVFGGSEGGNSGEYAAALLAARGHPTLSLCYFRCGKGSGRPNAIDEIELDYLTYAGRYLAQQPGADPGKLAVMGNSRGSEAAQLLGQRRPSVFRDVIAYAPSAKVNGPYLAGPSARAAWSDDGRHVPAGPIPLNRVRGTVLAVAGGNDKMWGAADSARRIAAQRNADGKPHQQVTYPKAGHHVNWFPYGQPGQEGGADRSVVATSGADQVARKDSWSRVLKLLGH